MLNLATLTPIQIDALREIGSIGAGHAATALSKMVRRPVKMSVPGASVIPLSAVNDLVGGPETQVWAIYLQMLGDLDGHIVFIVPQEEAATMVDRLMGRPCGTSATVDAMGESALAEVGNILTANYLIAMGDLAHLRLQPSPPMTANDMVSAILDGIVAHLSETSDSILSLETQLLIEGDGAFRGYLLMFPAPDTLPRLLAAIGLWHPSGGPRTP